jgi:hypothetical protein
MRTTPTSAHSRKRSPPASPGQNHVFTTTRRRAPRPHRRWTSRSRERRQLLRRRLDRHHIIGKSPRRAFFFVFPASYKSLAWSPSASYCKACYSALAAFCLRPYILPRLRNVYYLRLSLYGSNATHRFSIVQVRALRTGCSRTPEEGCHGRNKSLKSSTLSP